MPIHNTHNIKYNIIQYLFINIHKNKIDKRFNKLGIIIYSIWIICFLIDFKIVVGKLYNIY